MTTSQPNNEVNSFWNIPQTMGNDHRYIVMTNQQLSQIMICTQDDQMK